MKLIKAFRQYLAYEKAEQELRALSDRDLADLGISRCDIHKVVRG